MRKTLILLLAAALFVTVSACSLTQQAPPTPSPVPTEDPSVILAASDTNTAAAAQSHVPPVSDTNTVVNSDPYRQAITYIGQPVADLYAAIGQPLEAGIYAASTVQSGADDGTLHYNGFFVQTLRSEAGEFVYDVYLDDPLPQTSPEVPAPAEGQAAG